MVCLGQARLGTSDPLTLTGFSDPASTDGLICASVCIIECAWYAQLGEGPAVGEVKAR